MTDNSPVCPAINMISCWDWPRNHFVCATSQCEMTLQFVTSSLIGWAHTHNDPWDGNKANASWICWFHCSQLISNLVLLRSEYPRERHKHYSCWCPGSLCHQAISNHDIDYVRSLCPYPSSFSLMRKYLNFVWTCVITASRNDREFMLYDSTFLQSNQHVTGEMFKEVHSGTDQMCIDSQITASCIR